MLEQSSTGRTYTRDAYADISLAVMHKLAERPAPARRHSSSRKLVNKAFATVHRQSRSGNLSNQFADLLAQAGLREKSPHRSKGKGRGSHRTSNGLSFHSLRHTAVSLLKDAGIPEAVVMELVGHDSKAMSAHYTHVGAEALEKAVAALPEI